MRSIACIRSPNSGGTTAVARTTGGVSPTKRRRGELPRNASERRGEWCGARRLARRLGYATPAYSRHTLAPHALREAAQHVQRDAPIHDALAIAAVVPPDRITTTSLHVDVETRVGDRRRLRRTSRSPNRYPHPRTRRDERRGSRWDFCRRPYPLHQPLQRGATGSGRERADPRQRQRCRDRSYPARSRLRRHRVRARRERLDRELLAAVELDPGWRARGALLRACPASGPSPPSRCSRVPELGSVTGKQIAALVGVAPINRDSGSKRGNATCTAAAPASARCSTWPPSPPCITTPPCKPSINANSRRQTLQSRPHRQHAQTPRHPQRHAKHQQAWNPSLST